MKKRAPITRRGAAKSGSRLKAKLDPITQGVQAVIRTLSEPGLILGMVLVALLIITHTTDETKAPVLRLAKVLSARAQTRWAGDWMNENPVKAVTIISYVMTALMVAPMQVRPLWAAYAFALGYLVPEPSGYEAVYQCLTAAAVLRTRSGPGRMVLIGTAVAAYLTGFIEFGKQGGAPAQPVGAATARG